MSLADQQAASYADLRARALGLRYARLTVPWDAATSQRQAVAAWLAAVRAAGMAPHVAFEAPPRRPPASRRRAIHPTAPSIRRHSLARERMRGCRPST